MLLNWKKKHTNLNQTWDFVLQAGSLLPRLFRDSLFPRKLVLGLFVPVSPLEMPPRFVFFLGKWQGRSLLDYFYKKKKTISSIFLTFWLLNCLLIYIFIQLDFLLDHFVSFSKISQSVDTESWILGKFCRHRFVWSCCSTVRFVLLLPQFSPSNQLMQSWI